MVEHISEVQTVIAAAVEEQSSTSNEIANSISGVAHGANETTSVAVAISEMAVLLEARILELRRLFEEE
jgi:methyl-accepting chemotaxis protein